MDIYLEPKAKHKELLHLIFTFGQKYYPNPTYGLKLKFEPLCYVEVVGHSIVN